MADDTKRHENQDVLSANQKRAIAALLRCTTVAAASREAGLSERTLFRYLREQDFSAALMDRQDQVLKTTTAAIVGLSEQANETLGELMGDAETPASVRARVALGVWQYRQAAVELGALVDRLTALEAAIEGS